MTNAFDALVLDVNQKLSEMNTAASDANGAAASATEAAQNADEKAAAAQTAQEDANAAAAAANSIAALWEGATVEATTLAAGSAATLDVTEADGKKTLSFGIPRGATGAQGPKGDTGPSGVTFRLSGTSLYITTG